MVGIVHIMNTGWESARSLNAAVADKIFLNTSPVVSFLLIAFRTSPKSCNPTGLETPEIEKNYGYDF